MKFVLTSDFHKIHLANFVNHNKIVVQTKNIIEKMHLLHLEKIEKINRYSKSCFFYITLKIILIYNISIHIFHFLSLYRYRVFANRQR